ncbi:MAG TPA: Stk1 family PASTA domain-containing Ser/Thr kinase [Nocardioidaceae bacterium]|nr:Stk1 family PASTA domain-containing Ser/Thr kinase [Nocardioidaceae bacterium]
MTDENNGGPGPKGRSTGTGLRVGDRYELGELLGRGGMAEVRKGNDVRLGRVVAIKRLRTDLASDATFQARFRREAQSAASLNHPAIVAVYDTGEEHDVEGSDVPQPYIVMEYVAGRTLRDILREGRKILPERALEITSGVLSALDYSHRAGIVHRDIKPANVMLTPTGDVKVMDFGIARAVADASSTMTQTAAVVGTAQYLSPEQARGETVDSRSDVYSTGCLLYELLTGRPPFVGESPVSVAYQHVREQAAPPSSLDPDLPPEVDAIVMKALAKRVEDRYQSAAAMRADIERFLAGKPVTAAAVPADDATAFIPPEPETGATSVFGGGMPPEEREDERRKRWPFVLLALAVLALVVIAAVFGPKLFSSAPPQKSVPTLLHLTQAQASKKLHQSGLKLGSVDHKASPDYKKGQVMAQDPKPGDTIPPGSKVDITVSTGQPNVVIPYVTGMDKDAAQQKIEARGLRVKLVKRQSDSPRDTVIGTRPNQAESVSKGTLVTVFYSAGPHKVPNVVGMTRKHAISALKAAGFAYSVTHDSQTPSQKGTVLAQSPPAYSHQPQGTTVVITVSSYEQPTPTPTPTPSETPTPTPTPTPTETSSPSPSSLLSPSAR